MDQVPNDEQPQNVVIVVRSHPPYLFGDDTKTFYCAIETIPRQPDEQPFDRDWNDPYPTSDPDTDQEPAPDEISPGDPAAGEAFDPPVESIPPENASDDNDDQPPSEGPVQTSPEVQQPELPPAEPSTPTVPRIEPEPRDDPAIDPPPSADIPDLPEPDMKYDSPFGWYHLHWTVNEFGKPVRGNPTPAKDDEDDESDENGNPGDLEGFEPEMEDLDWDEPIQIDDIPVGPTQYPAGGDADGVDDRLGDDADAEELEQLIDLDTGGPIGGAFDGGADFDGAGFDGASPTFGGGAIDDGGVDRDAGLGGGGFDDARPGFDGGGFHQGGGGGGLDH